MHFGLQSMFYKYTWGSNQWFEGKDKTMGKHLDLVTCRRDSCAFQAVLWAEEDFLFTISPDPLFWKGGPLQIARLELDIPPQLRPEVKMVGLIGDDDGTLKSDILLDQQHMFVEKRRIQQVWVELRTAADIAPRIYSGKLKLFVYTMFEDERLQEEVSFTLRVKEETLPKPKDYEFYLDLWQHNSNIARKYDAGLWTEEHFTVLDHYLQSMAELGQKALSIVVSEIPWSGQKSHTDREPSDMFEYSMVRVRRREDTSMVYDFSAMDRYIELGHKHGIRCEIGLFGLLNIWQCPDAGYGSIVEDYPDGIRVRYLDERKGNYRFIRKRYELEAYIQALEAHFIEKGWIELVRILADEPSDVELFQQRLSCLQQTAPSFKYKVAINHVEFIQQNVEGMYDYVPILNCITSEFERLQQLRPDIRGKLLYYVCCVPDKPNTFIGSPAIESRIIPWLAEKLQLHGFLRWNYTVWPDKPLEKITYRSDIWRAGDMNFVYPGKLGKPLLSLRYKWLQRGIRDYEYMQMLKRLGRREWIDATFNQVFYFTDPKELNKESGKQAWQLYSLDCADYDELYRYEG
jgi:hypothetical protein